jgi:hypothetical protein
MRLQRVILAAVLAVPTMAWAGETQGKPPAPAAEVAPAKTEDNVRITLRTIPPRKAFVKWGKKNLGMIPVPNPLIVVRPRDSGPLDLVIRMQGYLPVHTRAYTFSNSIVNVKLTPLEEKNKLFGYRQELPPEGEAAPAASAPDPSAPTPAPAPTNPAPPQTTTAQ